MQRQVRACNDFVFQLGCDQPRPIIVVPQRGYYPGGNATTAMAAITAAALVAVMVAGAAIAGAAWVNYAPPSLNPLRLLAQVSSLSFCGGAGAAHCKCLPVDWRMGAYFGHPSTLPPLLVQLPLPRSIPAHPCHHLLKALLLLLPLAGRAQGYAEGVSLSYERLPLQLKTADSPAFHADVYRASAIVPVATAADSSHSFLAGAGLELLRFAGNRPGFGVGTVYGLLPIVGYRRRLSERLELTALALPALNSDLREVHGADITWGGVLRAAYRRSPRRAYRLTVGYRQQFYGPQYVLLLGLDWRLGQRWRLFGDLPTSLTLSYAAAPRINVGFSLLGINTAYRLRAADQYVQYQQGHYGLFAETYLSTHWVLRATTAYAVTRRIAVYARDQQWPATLDYIGLGTKPEPTSPDIAKGLAFKIGLSYRVPVK